MLMKPAPALVVFDKVTKFNTEVEPPGLIFGSMSFSLPTNRKIAILGRQESGRSTLLQLMLGQLRPDAGGVSTRTRFSMILNGKSYLHSGMTPLENVASLGRLYAVNPYKLMKLAVTLPGVKPELWHETVKYLEMRDRKAIELVVAALLPFDCYLIDDLEKLDMNQFALMVRLTAPRQAGFIFSTFSPKYARNFADLACVISNRKVFSFGSVDEALDFYDN